MSSLPYVSTPGTVEKALKAIQQAATPPSVSQDFVKAILGIKGGQGNQITSFLKKIGFAATDGTPTELYKRFRNPSTQGAAASEAVRTGYKPLYSRNEYMHALTDEKLKGLIVEETGASAGSSMVSQIFGCIRQLLKFAKAEASEVVSSSLAVPPRIEAPANDTNTSQNTGGASGAGSSGLKLNLGYTINLNLPATSDPAVFNAIFKSLRENLLRSSDGDQ